MSSLYMWVKTDLMACLECLSYYKHKVYRHWLGPRSYQATLSQIPQLQTPLFYFLAKYIWHSADLWVTNYSLRNLSSKQRPLPLTTILSCFHDAPALLGHHGNSHPYLCPAGTPRMMASIHNDRKVGGSGTNGPTCGWQSLCRTIFYSVKVWSHQKVVH